MTTPPPRALLVGIDCYLHLPPKDHLLGAVRDAEEMADLLERRFDFPADGIRLLRNEEATRGAVEAALGELATRVGEGTVVVIHWSGHGSRVQSQVGIGLDETLVPYDRGDGVEDLRDQELVRLLAPLEARGASLTWIADACHSGHLFRDPAFGRSRRVAPRAGAAPRPGARPVLDGLAAWVRRPDRQVLLAACRADQEAFETSPFDGKAHGEWTRALLEVLRRAPADVTARQVVEAARARLITREVGQAPQLVGARDRLIFGVAARPPVRYVEVRSAEGRQLELAGGAAQGLVAGSLWRIERRGDDKAGGGPRARIVRVGATSSQAELEGTTRSGGRRIAPGDPAFEVVPAYGEPRLAVRLAGSEGSSLWTAVEAGIAASPVLRRAEAGEEEAATVELDASSCRAVDPRGFPLFGPSPPAEDTARLVVARLERRARCRHGLGLENRDPSSEVAGRLRFRVLRQDGRGDWVRAEPEPRSATAAPEELPEYRSGDRIAFEVAHEDPSYDGELFVYVLDFGLTDGVTQLYPSPGGMEVLYPGTTKPAGTVAGEGIELWWPEGLDDRNGGVDTFKLFATTQETEFDWIRTDVGWPQTYRSGPASLRGRLAMGPQGPVYRSSGDDWGTALASIWLWRTPRS